MKNNARVQAHHNSKSQSGAKQAEKGDWVVQAHGVPIEKLTESEQLAVSRIHEKLHDKEEWEFIRVDHLLFTEDEKIEMEALEDGTRWKRRQRRIQKLFDVVRSLQLTMLPHCNLLCYLAATCCVTSLQLLVLPHCTQLPV